MSYDHWIALAGVVIAFGLLCVAIWKIRAADWREINNKIESVAIQLAAFKLHVAEMHPTAPELQRMESNLTSALNRLAERIDRLLERDGR